MPTIISVIGGSSPSDEEYKTAEELGILLAKERYIVACGGLGGVMEAVCKGAKAEGGQTIGILPSKDPKDANQYVDKPIATGLGDLRNSLVVQTGEIVVAIGGQYGTLNEISYALLKGKTVIGINTWEAKSPNSDFPVIRVNTAAAALKKIQSLLAQA